jgi:hypothetical protein
MFCTAEVPFYIRWGCPSSLFRTPIFDWVAIGEMRVSLGSNRSHHGKLGSLSALTLAEGL